MLPAPQVASLESLPPGMSTFDHENCSIVNVDMSTAVPILGSCQEKLGIPPGNCHLKSSSKGWPHLSDDGISAAASLLF